jgi:hypothetical protein
MKFGFSDVEFLDSTKQNLLNPDMGICTTLHFMYTLWIGIQQHIFVLPQLQVWISSDI